MLRIEKAKNRIIGEGENPWTVSIIDYYGPGCTSPGGSKDWLAILPERNRD
jgi:hypothetical protein